MYLTSPLKWTLKTLNNMDNWWLEYERQVIAKYRSPRYIGYPATITEPKETIKNTENMTIEEKAKAYDEALERAKSQIAAGLVNQDVCEYILPGLVETEDKKIAEALIKTLKEKISLGVVSNGYSREDYIEWLEKYLKTNSEKPKEWLKEDYDYYDTIVRKLEVIGEDSGLTRNQIQFLSEHNPCDFEVEIEKAYKNADEVQYRKGFKDGVASVKSPEWTGEDIAMCKLLIAIMEVEHPGGLFAVGELPLGCNVMPVKRVIEWLKNLLKEHEEN